MIYFIGDTHGDFGELANKLAVRGIRDSQLVQVGDFGLGFGNKNEEELNLKTLNKTLKTGNNLLYVIRGNHDDPSYFATWEKIGNIRLVPDYSVLELGGYNVLLVGGAISIDRNSRIQGKDYWKEEEFIFDPDKLDVALNEIQRVDIVVTHTAPNEFWPFDLGNLVRAYARQDVNLISDLAKERELHSILLKYITNKYAPPHWYYGHFHTTNNGEYSGIKYFALGEAEIREHIGGTIVN